MNPEDRMRDLMRGADGTEPPSEAEWDAFVGRAHRSLAVHRALSVAAVVVVLALGAIGGRAIVDATRSDSNLDPVKSPTPTETKGVVVPGPTETTPAPDETEVPTEEPVSIEQWVVSEDGHLWLTHERVEHTAAIATSATTVLLEKTGDWTGRMGEQRLSSAIPAGTELLGLTIENEIATVDLSSEFAAPSGSAAERLRLAQVVYTLTQFPTVNGVVFEIEGQRQEFFGSHGIDVQKPKIRREFDDIVTPIVVESPAPYETVDETFTVTGTANVFEANVSYRLIDGDGFEVDYRALDAQGNEVDPGYTTATCGTGCRGEFSFTVELIQDLDVVIVQVFQASAEDGSPRDVVEVPVNVRNG